MSIQGAINIQGGPTCDVGGGPAPTPGELTWFDLGPLVAAHGNFANRDTNLQFSSITAVGNNITPASLNTVSVDGTAEGWAVDLGDPAASIPGWVSDGTCGLAVYITVIADAPDNKGYWVGAGLGSSAAAPVGGGIVYYRTTVTNSTAANQTGNASVAAMAAPYGVVGIASDASPVQIAWAPQPTSSGSLTSNIIAVTDLRLCVWGGCESALGDGPHSATVRIQVAAFKLVPPP